MQNQEILANNIDSISRYIKGLSYAGHGCFSLYWTMCEKKSINARFFIEYFPVGSRAFRAKYRLFSSQQNYKENRWSWIRKILLKLEEMEFINIEPLRESPPLSLHPARLFENANYALSPRISKLTFKFPKGDGESTLRDIISVHQFLTRFVPRHIPPRYYPQSALKRSLQNKIKKAKGVVAIRFPTNL